MVYSFREGLATLQALSKSLAGYQKESEEVVNVYKKNQEQLGKLNDVLTALQDPENPNRGLVPGLERAQRNAVSQNENAVLGSYMDSADAINAIKQIGKEYITKAKGELQGALVAVFGYLATMYNTTKKTAKTVANTDVMKPKMAKRIGQYASILK